MRKTVLETAGASGLELGKTGGRNASKKTADSISAMGYEDVHLVRQNQGWKRIESVKPGGKLEVGKK